MIGARGQGGLELFEILCIFKLKKYVKRKEDCTMATSTFDRKIVINDDESADNLIKILTADEPKKPSSRHPFSYEDRKRSEELLRHYVSHSKR